MSKALVNKVKLNDFIDVKDYGAVADGNMVAGGSPSGTDNLAAFNAAFADAIAKNIFVVRAVGFYYISGKLTLPRGVTLEGAGSVHLPLFLQGGFKRGTALLINGAIGNDCLAFEENAGHSKLKDIAVFNTNTNAIRSVISIVGHLYPRMINVEVASLRKTTGSGIYMSPSTTGALYETLWGEFDNVVVNNTDVNTANAACVKYGLYIYSTGVGYTCNANSFKGGQYSGTSAALYMDGAGAGATTISCVFHGTKFDLNWDTSALPVIQYQAAAKNVFGWLKNNVYIFPIVYLKRASSTLFSGCYFEAAGMPGTYNDGVNGTFTILGTLWLDSSAVTGTVADGCAWNACYLYDNSVRCTVNPTTSGYKHTSNFVTHGYVQLTTGGGQSVPNTTWTKVLFNNIRQGDDSNLEWDATNFKFKVRYAGVYLINSRIGFDGWVGTTAGAIRTHVDGLSSGTFSIPGGETGSSGIGVQVSVDQTLALNLFEGDNVWIEVFHAKGSNATLFANECYFSMTKL